MSRLFAAWRRHKLLTSAFVLAAVLTVFFGARMVIFAVYWSDPAHRDQAPQGWMTPRYVTHSWRVPPEVMLPVLGPRPEAGRPRTLEQIAARQGVPLDELIGRIEAAVAAFRAAGQ